mmetsp:Transcript_16080/g.21253  ORF Transcript_16080/g.21253 Transcript_16080/m.21253 type:complete len:311 (-) Transcript_16080:268-1200(-)|eukprot:CAMPEP_0117756116 /NCGR_PEP_ID=MMETSP0947-20121206/13863_1 /TAXON_ID=44440 /ORGANISM="Chattonella subsalsa, Strain CCMP2191" /LENGTH=310 /DNA_ID=CAMNT_0005575595 /DNA_START=90 /DNA_END=1022 /DNA_ORIENTATION=+
MASEINGNDRCLIITFLLLYIISVGLFGGAFQILPPLKMAIARNNVRSNIDSTKVYLNGRFFLGLGMEFIQFPSTAIQMYIDDVSAATKDKQSVTIDVACQYQLNPDDLVTLYQERQTSYESFYQREVTEAIKEESVEWETNPDFYHNREEIAAAMKTRVAERFSSNLATLVDFQVLKIDLPSATETKIIETIVEEQENTLAQYQQDASVIRKQATNEADKAAAEVAVINAEADATAALMVAEAEAKAFEIVLNATSDGLIILSNKMNLTASDLMRYLWYDVIAGDTSKDLVVGLDGVLRDSLASSLVDG